MAKREKPLNPSLIPTAFVSLAAFTGLSWYLGDQLAQGKDPKVKAQKKSERPVKTVIKKKIVTKKIVVWKTPQPVQQAAAPQQSTETTTYVEPSYTPPQSEPAPSPAPSTQSGAS